MKWTRWTYAVIVLIISVFAAFYAWQIHVPTGTDRMRQEEDIRQAVFQYQFLHNASGQQQHAIVYCLSAGEVILSDDFMKRFLGNTPRVVRASACETHFVLFKANKITWENSRKVIVQGGYYEDGDSASGNTYTVVRRITGRWTVTKDKMNWIS